MMGEWAIDVRGLGARGVGVDWEELGVPTLSVGGVACAVSRSSSRFDVCVRDGFCEY